MQRTFSDILLGWKRQPARKPLVVKGARQTGKTYAIRQFGRSAYDALCEVNFETGSAPSTR